MAGTASPRSDPQRERRAALARFLTAASGAETVEISGLVPLRGGAIQENWAVDACFSGGSLAGDQALVLRTAAPTGVPASLDPLQEFAVLKAAFAAGVTVPEPLFASGDPAIFGKPFFIMRRIDGIAAAHRITRDAALEPALPAIAERLGRELARIHRIRPPRSDLAFLPAYEEVGPTLQIAGFRAYLDHHPTPRPVLEWGIRWLETHTPSPSDPVLCHHDFRTGNYMLDGTTLTGILDWEFAGWGDPHEDIGWFCCKGWRFARLDREAGGISGRAPFYRGYESEAGRAIDPSRVFFWELLASVRWAIIALQQSDRYFSILPECRRMRDLPTGSTLLALARDVLLGDLMPLLPEEARLDARLVANSMAIAEREAEAADGLRKAIARELEKLYRWTGEGEEPENLLRCFARDLRVDRFKGSEPQERKAREILWQLTISKLRQANPRFLAANGFR